MNDGRLMITGGQTSRRVTFYDPFLDEWAIGPQMIIGRGYQSQLTLEEGSVFVLGGSWNGGIGGKDGEVWTEAGGWQLKPGIRAIGSINTNDIEGLFRSDSHMWLFEAPNGRIFHAGPAKRMHWIDLDGNGTVTQSLLRGDDLDAMNGNAVMYDVGKIFTVGGAENYDSGHASSRAYAIDINGGEALVQRVGDMSFPRAFCNSVVLPSGEIIVVGGQEKVKLFSDTDAVLYVEIWDPWTGEFTELSSLITVPRTYHSIGLLLRDGRVLSGGGGLCGNSCDYATEIVSRSRPQRQSSVIILTCRRCSHPFHRTTPTWKSSLRRTCSPPMGHWRIVPLSNRHRSPSLPVEVSPLSWKASFRWWNLS